MNQMNQHRHEPPPLPVLPPNQIPPIADQGQRPNPLGRLDPNQSQGQGHGPSQGQAHLSFAGSLAQMLAALDRELEIVAKAGSDAFSQKDLARADAALKFSERLTEFRKTANQLLDYYRRR